jgi:hypothetical protein
MAIIYKHYPKQDKRFVVVYPHETVTLYEGSGEYERMMEAVEAGEAEIVEVDDTPVPTWEDNRIAAYGSWREQLDHMYHGTWEDHVASVKATYPKPE